MNNRYSLALGLMLIAGFPILAGGQQSTPATDDVDPAWVIATGNQGERRPAIHVVRSSDALDALDLSPEITREVTAGVDFSTSAAVVVLAGTRTSGGYRLKLGQVSRSDREIVIRVVQHGPAQDEIVTQALTYPYIVIGITDPPPSIVVDGPQP